MKDLTVCVGSSCHLKGSYQVIQTFERLIKQHGLTEKVKLKASFCQGKCMRGISCQFDGEPIQDVNMANAEEIFNQKVLPNVE